MKSSQFLIFGLFFFMFVEHCLGEAHRPKSSIELFEQKIESQIPVLIMIAPWAASDPKRGGAMMTFSDVKCSLISDRARIDEFCKGIRKYQANTEVHDMRGDEYSLVFVFGEGEPLVIARLLKKKSGDWFFVFQNPGENPNKDREVIAAGPSMVAILEKNFIKKWKPEE